MSLIIPMMLILMISMIIMKMSVTFSLKKKKSLEKSSPFECGFNPIENSRIPFSMRFFLITIIFLIFDVEIALMIPMIYTFKISKLNIWFYTSLLFIMILLIGLFHEWNQGALNWL